MVRIATIGGIPDAGTERNSKQLVLNMLSYWALQVGNVLSSKPDFILLPETCDSPSGLTPEEEKVYIQERHSQVLDMLAVIARDNNCYIAVGTKRLLVDGSYRNSLVLIDRKGVVQDVYDKNYPTIDEMNAGIKPSNKTPIFSCDFGTVAPAICFDLNFQELRERYVKAKPDIIIFSSAFHGGLAQTTWAYSCRAYFVSAIGGKNLLSEIRNPLGEVVRASTNYFNYAVASINLDCQLAHLDYNWEKLANLKKKYGESVTIHDPGKLGSVLISSFDQNITAVDMIKEFEIELLDEYFERSRSLRESMVESEIFPI